MRVEEGTPRCHRCRRGIASWPRRSGLSDAIAIEASPWIEDNLWLLQIEETDPIAWSAQLGIFGLRSRSLKKYLERYHKNKLFLGLRYGNLWSYSLVQEVSNPVFSLKA